MKELLLAFVFIFAYLYDFKEINMKNTSLIFQRNSSTALKGR